MTRAMRNRLAVENQELLQKVVSYLKPRFPQIDREELHGWGNIAMLRALEKYDAERGSLPAYLFCAVMHGTIDLMRRNHDVRRVELPPLPVTLRCGGFDHFIDLAAPDPEVEGQRSADFVKVRRALSELPPRWLTLVRLRYLDDLTFRECGARLGVNESRASQIHKAAIAKVRRALEETRPKKQEEAAGLKR